MEESIMDWDDVDVIESFPPHSFEFCRLCARELDHTPEEHIESAKRGIAAHARQLDADDFLAEQILAANGAPYSDDDR